MAPSALSRMLSPKKAEEEQYAPDGMRDLSDTTHEDYDPATDPELRQSSCHRSPPSREIVRAAFEEAQFASSLHVRLELASLRCWELRRRRVDSNGRWSELGWLVGALGRGLVIREMLGRLVAATKPSNDGTQGSRRWIVSICSTRITSQSFITPHRIALATNRVLTMSVVLQSFASPVPPLPSSLPPTERRNDVD